MFEVARVELGEAAVGEVEDGEVDAEDVGDAFHLLLPPRTHLLDGEAEVVADFRRPAFREREEVDIVALADLPGDHGGGAERFVVGVGEDVEKGHRGRER